MALTRRIKGFLAATNGADDQSNPGKTGTDAAAEWNEGFQAGAFSFDEDAIFDDGYAAFNRGTSAGNCPHLDASQDRTEWLSGWHKARARGLENDRFMKSV